MKSTNTNFKGALIVMTLSLSVFYLNAQPIHSEQIKTISCGDHWLEAELTIREGSHAQISALMTLDGDSQTEGRRIFFNKLKKAPVDNGWKIIGHNKKQGIEFILISEETPTNTFWTLLIRENDAQEYTDLGLCRAL